MTAESIWATFASVENGKSIGEMVTFVHFSDLHIASGGSEARGLLANAVERARRIAADALVVTGDLTEHGTYDDYSAAIHSMRMIAGEFPESVIVPGNHDSGATAEAFALARGSTPTPERLDELLDHCCPRGRSVGVSRFPTRTDLAGGRCVVYGLDSSVDVHDLPLSARGKVGDEQLAELESDLKTLDPEQRRVVVLHHHINRLPIGRKLIEAIISRDEFMALIDRKALRDLLRRYDVNLVLHGHRHYYSRRRRGLNTIIQACSTTKGCCLTGEMFFNKIILNLDSGEVHVRRVAFAPPKRSRTLAAAFIAQEQMEDWIALVLRAYDTEDTFQSFYKAMSLQASRFRVLDALNERLDNELDAMLEQVDRPPFVPISRGQNVASKPLTRDHVLQIMLLAVSALADGDKAAFEFNDGEEF